MNKRTLDKMRTLIKSYDDNFVIPHDYVKKYNRPGAEFECPGGRAWVMWFIDQLEVLK